MFLFTATWKKGTEEENIPDLADVEREGAGECKGHFTADLCVGLLWTSQLPLIGNGPVTSCPKNLGYTITCLFMHRDRYPAWLEICLQSVKKQA